MRLEFGLTRAPRNILFGKGQRRAIGHMAKSVGQKILVCTDSRLASLDVMHEIRGDLENLGMTVEVFYETEAELPLRGITDCVAAYKKFEPDMIAGIGGGSCLDMAKLVSLLLSFDRPVEEFYGEFKVPGPLKPIIAVPTTSGTGSEATPVAVLADPRRANKVGISSPELIPHTAICDPELTVSCPAGLTAISGADALAHAIESFASFQREPAADIASSRVFVGKNGLSDMFALEAIRKISKSLRQCVKHGDDLNARANVMMGSLLAGLSFGTGGTSAAHAIQYPVGAKTNTAHGLGIGVLLPYVIEHNLSSAIPAYGEIGRAMGAAPENDPDSKAAKAMLSEIRKLFTDIGIPKTLADIGLPENSLREVAQSAMGATRLVENNPGLLDEAGALNILNNAFYGITESKTKPAKGMADA